jgi:hypothetical protein
LILDGQGDPDSVFIFKMGFDGTGLTVGPGSEVQLTGDASPCNVFWEVNTASINTTAVFKGNILALNSITVARGANIEGRLLARNANVTLIADTVAIGVCGTPTLRDVVSTAEVTPTLPNTGVAPFQSNIPWNVIILVGIFAISVLFVVIRRKKII